MEQGAVVADDQDRRLLDDTARSIASMVVTAQAEKSTVGWSVTYATEAPIHLPPAVNLAVWPSTVPGSRKKLANGQRLEASFSTPLEAVSGFLSVEVATGELSTQFCIPVLIDGLPDDRDAQLMRTLIGNAGRFFAYLLALLSDVNGESDLLSDVSSATWGDETWSAGFDGASQAPVLERMLRSMRTDPTKLLEIRPLVQAMDGDGILPTEFIDLWLSVVAVASRRP